MFCSVSCHLGQETTISRIELRQTITTQRTELYCTVRPTALHWETEHYYNALHYSVVLHCTLGQVECIAVQCTFALYITLCETEVEYISVVQWRSGRLTVIWIKK